LAITYLASQLAKDYKTKSSVTHIRVAIKELAGQSTKQTNPKPFFK
jgi:hypothetical protein